MTELTKKYSAETIINEVIKKQTSGEEIPIEDLQRSIPYLKYFKRRLAEALRGQLRTLKRSYDLAEPDSKTPFALRNITDEEERELVLMNIYSWSPVHGCNGSCVATCGADAYPTQDFEKIPVAQMLHLFAETMKLYESNGTEDITQLVFLEKSRIVHLRSPLFGDCDSLEVEGLPEILNFVKRHAGTAPMLSTTIPQYKKELFEYLISLKWRFERSQILGNLLIKFFKKEEILKEEFEFIYDEYLFEMNFGKLDKFLKLDESAFKKLEDFLDKETDYFKKNATQVEINAGITKSNSSFIKNLEKSKFQKESLIRLGLNKDDIRELERLKVIIVCVQDTNFCYFNIINNNYDDLNRSQEDNYLRRGHLCFYLKKILADRYNNEIGRSMLDIFDKTVGNSRKHNYVTHWQDHYKIVGKRFYKTGNVYGGDSIACINGIQLRPFGLYNMAKGGVTHEYPQGRIIATYHGLSRKKEDNQLLKRKEPIDNILDKTIVIRQSLPVGIPDSFFIYDGLKRIRKITFNPQNYLSERDEIIDEKISTDKLLTFIHKLENL
ncbi:hypothetical protein A2483_04295 [Candidatus Peregrinibacteria bacterium RIFOXYC2_FULL_33_13]|nr:MAG: hypothetical protein UR27_C0010G0030 [Candidatus Peregrinibacteria bacterium GW2011_GWA2_33_10]KKP41218.1 MAG: hypothetical protein UR30_C0001G0065 [Candidatus Peregrinibacteria bacterium GW2011_GWC2_33_13]OGJ52042.1 MAG: hypothetical protein A2483_04295 [Candidatus Peregrinibacteria bacterium RIFOXYC2_FULL_33_13]